MIAYKEIKNMLRWNVRALTKTTNTLPYNIITNKLEIMQFGYPIGRKFLEYLNVR